MKKIGNELLKIYTEEYQYDKCIEELAELIVALSHKKQNRTYNSIVLNEIADVEICLETVKLLLNDAGNYNQILNDKLIRIRQREGLI